MTKAERQVVIANPHRGDIGDGMSERVVCWVVE